MTRRTKYILLASVCAVLCAVGLIFTLSNKSEWMEYDCYSFDTQTSTRSNLTIFGKRIIVKDFVHDLVHKNTYDKQWHSIECKKPKIKWTNQDILKLANGKLKIDLVLTNMGPNAVYHRTYVSMQTQQRFDACHYMTSTYYCFDFDNVICPATEQEASKVLTNCSKIDVYYLH